MNNGNAFRVFGLCSLLALLALAAGCASDKTAASAGAGAGAAAPGAEAIQTDRQSSPAQSRFGEFISVELKQTTVAPPYNQQEANLKAARTIDQLLQQDLRNIFPNVKSLPASAEFSRSAERTLQIAPSITEIRLGSGSSTVWGTPTGKSELVLHVDFRDGSTGEIIAAPDFSRSNTAGAQGMSPELADAQVREALVRQILNYTTASK